MTSVISSQRENIPRKLPALPVIQHPLARLGNKSELLVRGSSRGSDNLEQNLSQISLQSGENGILPPVKRNSERKKKNHSRVLTWPVGQDWRKGHNQLPWVTKKSPLKVEELIKEKLTTGFFGLRQAFKSNDPLGRGNVSREALTTILYHLCGYLSTEQVDGLLQRLQLENRSNISFDSFIKHFRDVEIVQKEWVDPILRPSVEENVTANLPANKLRAEQRQAVGDPRHFETKSRQKKPAVKFLSAFKVVPLLKKQAQEGSLNITDIFPPACFNPDGMVLKPQLRTALLVIGVSMYDEEFDKLWDRFDSSGTGAMDSLKFFSMLGVNSIERNRKRKPSQPKAIETTESNAGAMPQEETTAIEKETSDKKMWTSSSEVTKQAAEETSNSVLKLLSQKFKEGYNNMLQSFLKFDADKTGKVTKDDFRKLLAHYHLHLEETEVEHLLQRCGMQKEPMVSYQMLLDHFQDRSERGLLHIVMEDSRHRFNQSRESAIGSTTAVDAEAKILDLLQSDFLSLLDAFKQLDRHRMGVVPRYQFLEMLKARFHLSLGDKQLISILKLLNVDPQESLVPYPKFLELFSSARSEIELAKMLPQDSFQERPRTCPTQSHAGMYLSRSLSEGRGIGRSVSRLESKEHLSRDTNSLLVTIRDIITDKFHVINKTHLGMSKRKGTLDKETFRRLMERHELKLSSAEVDRLWTRFPTDSDSMVNFSDMVEYCLSIPGKNVKLSRVLQEYAKKAFRKSLDTHTEMAEPDEEQYEKLTLPTETEEQAEESSTRLPQFNKSKSEKPSFESIVKKPKDPFCSTWQELRDEFKELHVDRKNTLLYSEFQLREANGLNREVALNTIFNKIHPKMMSDWKSLRRTFKKLDLSGDGFLSVSEFRVALQSFEFPLNDEDFYHIFSAYDTNLNGSISYVDFMRRSLSC